MEPTNALFSILKVVVLDKSESRVHSISQIIMQKAEIEQEKSYPLHRLDFKSMIDFEL